AACWSELIRCYSGQDSAILLGIARPTDSQAGAFDVSLPAAPTGSVRAWLSEVAQLIEESATGSTKRTLLREDSRKSLAEKLSTGTVVMIRKEGEAGCNGLLTGITRLLLLEVLIDGGLELRATYRIDYFSAEVVDVLLGCLRHMLPQLPSLDTRPVSELELAPRALRGQHVSADNYAYNDGLAGY